MTHANARFLSMIDTETKAAIITSIAKHYGITDEAAYAEVTADNAYQLLEYMIEPMRSATLVIMQATGFYNVNGETPQPI